MATNPVSRKWTFEEYLAYEQETNIRHEYIDGEIYAMAGAKENHSLIMMYSTAEIGVQLRGTSCRLYSNDTKIKVDKSKFVYPDFSVVCGEAKFKDDSRTILENPILVAEILSDSTEKYDRGLKSEFYRSLPLLKHYLIIAQSRIHIELYTRQTKGWLIEDFDRRDAIVSLDAIGVELPLSEIYRDIEFNDES